MPIINISPVVYQKDYVTRNELVEWINETLECEFTKIEQFRTGKSLCDK